MLYYDSVNIIFCLLRSVNLAKMDKWIVRQDKWI